MDEATGLAVQTIPGTIKSVLVAWDHQPRRRTWRRNRMPHVPGAATPRGTTRNTPIATNVAALPRTPLTLPITCPFRHLVFGGAPPDVTTAERSA
jgi:hypothetical protein